MIKSVDVELREGFVPAQFFELVGRVGSEHEKPADFLTLETLKADLSHRLWQESLQTLFNVTVNKQPSAQDRLACTN